jgi:hypothetical protein
VKRLTFERRPGGRSPIHQPGGRSPIQEAAFFAAGSNCPSLRLAEAEPTLAEAERAAALEKELAELRAENERLRSRR